MPYTYPEGCVFSTLEEIKGKHITVMGLGLNGGGEACVRFFLKHGAYVLATDMKSAEQLKPTIDSLSKDKTLDLSRLTYVLGQHRIEDFKNADCVIKNPGVKIEGNQYLSQSKAIETDISIFLHFTKAPIIAVTGSKGKSSTVSAIHYGLIQCGFKAFLGGNITVSPLTFLEKTDGTTPVVLELSSWQLADLRGRKALKPKIAVITKIVPDHQNWYHAMDPYVEDKKLIYKDQDENDWTILDSDPDDYIQESLHPLPRIESWGDLFASETKAHVLRYSKKELQEGMYGVYQKQNKDGITEGFAHLPPSLLKNNEPSHCDELLMSSLKVPGEHMKTNVLNAALVLRIMGVNPEEAKNVLSQWPGIEHRLEHFYEWSDPSQKIKAHFYNDSCATVPEAAAAASQSFSKKTILITGGTDKGLDFSFLADTLASKNGEKECRKIYLLSGSGTDKLKKLLDQNKTEYEGPFESLESLLESLKNDLLKLAKTEKKAEEIPVVFSPGATSFGMFTNEFDRGNKFKSFTKAIFK